MPCVQRPNRVSVLGIISYAQNFEDVMLWRALKSVAKGRYIDVGAQHPRIDSVSQAFFEKGWTGVHIEPAAEYAALLRAERPGDKVIEAAISSRRGQASFYRIPGTGLSSLDARAGNSGRSRGFDVVDEVVRTITLDDVFEGTDQDVHWLKIDVEGHEKSVLKGWKSDVRPWIVLIESTAPASTRETHQAWEQLVLEKGYIFVWFDGLNRFYVSQDHRDLADSFSSPPNVFDTFQLSGEATSTFAALLNERVTRAVEEGNVHRQWAAEHLVNVEAAAEARLGAVQADHLEQLKAREQALSDLADQFERDRHALTSDYSERLRNLTSENHQLVDKLVQAATEQAAMVVRHQQEQTRHDQLARDAFDEARRGFQQILRDAASERERLNETVASLRGELKDAQSDLQTARLAEQSVALEAATQAARLHEVTTHARKMEQALLQQLDAIRADHIETRRADAEDRSRLIRERGDLGTRVTEVQAALQVALQAEQAATAQAKSDQRVFALERETAASEMRTLSQALDEQRRLLHAWRLQIADLRSALLGERGADQLVQGLAGGDTSSQGFDSSSPALAGLDAELREISTVIVDMVRASEQRKNSFSVRLRTLIGRAGGLTNKYSIATTPQVAVRHAQNRSGTSSQHTSGLRTEALARGSGSFRWFGNGRTDASIAALQQRMDHLADLGAVLVAQGAGSGFTVLADRMDGIDATLSDIVSRLDHLADIGRISVAQGARLEQGVSDLASRGPASQEHRSEEQTETLSDALLLHGQNHPLSPTGMATLDALARALRSSNTR